MPVKQFTVLADAAVELAQVIPAEALTETAFGVVDQVDETDQGVAVGEDADDVYFCA
jgi:hypothetical protein